MKTKIMFVSLLAVLGLAIAGSSQAASSWKDYFSQDEGKAIKKMTDKYIREQLEENAKDWKGIISSKSVDNSIAKKKIYTFSTPACTEEAADKVTTDGNLDVLWKKVSADEIELSKNPIVNVYGKVSSGYVTELASEVWGEENYYLSEGAIWISYGDDDEDELNDVFDCSGTSQYKVSVGY